MNTRFALPVAVAVAAHATLLFGFSHGPAPIKVKPPKEKLPPALEMNQIDPPEAPTDPFSAAAKGLPDAFRPDTPDVPRPISARDFAINPSPALPFSNDSSAKIDGRTVGVLDGIEGGVKVTGGIVSSRFLDNPPNARVRMSPDYPREGRALGVDGEVLVEFIVDETGRVLNPTVVRSTNSIFEAPTVRAVLKWRFEPGIRDGRVVRFRMAVPVVFRLEDF